MRTFVLVAGEASGDLLAAELISELLKLDPKIRFVGIGGPRMRELGMETWFDAEELAVMGFAEVIGRLPRLLKIRKQFIQRCLKLNPACFIGIDAPDFNFAIERKMKQSGIPAIHYVSPSIWAWRQKRAKKIVRDTDLILTLFPFEPELYAQYHGRAEFVGHPLADNIPLNPDQQAAKAQLGIESTAPLIALLPGSRMGEIERIGPVLAQSVIALQQQCNAQFIAAMANERCTQGFKAQLAEHHAEHLVRFVTNQSQTVLTAADLGLIASGTATLEAVLCRTPMIVVYKISALTYRIVHDFGLMQVDQYSLPNKLAGRGLVTELMQDNLTPANLTHAAKDLLSDSQRLSEMRQSYAKVHQRLNCNASQQAAKKIIEFVSSR